MSRPAGSAPAVDGDAQAAPRGPQAGRRVQADRGRGRRRRRILGAVLAAAALVLAAAFGPGLMRAADMTLHPRPDDPPRVDALLVLYSQPAVYDAALELLDRGVADRVFVSAHLGPDGFEKFCGTPAQRDPRTRGVEVECFSPDPVTTQGEVMFAADRMRALGLRRLGVLTFDQHLERARLLAERCLPAADGSVSMYRFDGGYTGAEKVRQDVYGTAAFAKVALTTDCSGELPDVLQWPLDLVKRTAGMPVGAVAESAAGVGRAGAGVRP
ncbi:hypothetical protein KW076_05665 [Micrococcus porci]|uniref:hypothetical protein n=1 Tax=Micrococcus porci TaxID=2856555 RepID=UPI001CCF22DD|nr:hypothetical protein [Micrococcus porci]UBH25663.1 hypothetical protein KW076_05665 [Micrococcus porci]